MNQTTVTLHRTETGPSHILEPEHIKYIKIRANRGPVDDYNWSSEVYVSAEKLADNRTIQVGVKLVHNRTIQVGVKLGDNRTIQVGVKLVQQDNSGRGKTRTTRQFR
jgi:hypothetical protein